MLGKCFVARFESAVCHVAVTRREAQFVSTASVEDRTCFRAVLDETGHQPQFLDDAEGDSVVGAVNFLARRFGPCVEPPVPCRNEPAHILAATHPLRWAEALGTKRKVGGVSYEGRFFIVEVPDEWSDGDPLPAPSPEDRWFTHLADFVGAFQAPWSRKPVHRRPWNASAVERLEKAARSKASPV